MGPGARESATVIKSSFLTDDSNRLSNNSLNPICNLASSLLSPCYLLYRKHTQTRGCSPAVLHSLAIIRFCVFILSNNMSFHFAVFILKIRRKMNRLKIGGTET